MASMVADNFPVSTPFTVVLLGTFKSAAGFAATGGRHSITMVMMGLLNLSGLQHIAEGRSGRTVRATFA
jgi:hypothetical protein